MSAGESRRRHLGRGLDALLGSGGTEDATAASAAAAVRALPIEFIHRSRFQPRRDFDGEEMASLVRSVRQSGILQPILVRPDPDRSGSYQIIAGERRWRAAQEAQLHEVPVLIRELSDGEALEIALVENLQRQDLSPLEEANGYRRLMEEFSHTQEALARAVGKSRSHVANTMRLLSLPDAVKARLDSGQISAGHARALLGAPDPVALAEQVVRRDLTVRQTERLVQRTRAGPRPSAVRPRKGGARPDKSADTLALERDLSAALGLAVSINERGEGGELVIRYSTLEQLDEVIERLNSGI